MAWLDRAQHELGSLEDDVAAMQLHAAAGLRTAAGEQDSTLVSLRTMLAQRDRQVRGVPGKSTGALLSRCASRCQYDIAEEDAHPGGMATYFIWWGSHWPHMYVL